MAWKYSTEFTEAVRMSPGPHLPRISAIGGVFIAIIVNCVAESTGLRLTSMNVPKVADPRDKLELDCHFDMGNEELYAVKWYKDDQEFFRYMPRQDPSIIFFPVFGVMVVKQESSCDNSHCKVKLEKLSKRFSSGSYRCEISSEAPSFRLASETHNVTVAAIPKENPKIEGLATSYNEGEILSANCTSDFGDPAPTLRWYVDGQPTVPVSRPTYLEREFDILIAQSILLNMVVMNVSKSTLEISCEASMIGVPFLPQLTTTVVTLKSNHEDGVNNEKLQLWYSPYFHSTATLLNSSYQAAFSILLFAVLKWTLRF